MHDLIRIVEQEYLKKDVPVFAVGDTVKVMVKVIEGEKERLQAFEGIVIARKGGGVRESFTVRRMSYGIGVERVFQLHSPRIDRVDVIRKGKVRRAKLYYLRNLSGKAAKIKESVDNITTKKLANTADKKATAKLDTTKIETAKKPTTKK